MSTLTSRIAKSHEVCGGRACVSGHRIPVWGLVRYRQLGLNDLRILDAYPSIDTVDLEAAWDYYASHRDEIDGDIRDNDDEGD